MISPEVYFGYAWYISLLARLLSRKNSHSLLERWLLISDMHRYAVRQRRMRGDMTWCLLHEVLECVRRVDWPSIRGKERARHAGKKWRSNWSHLGTRLPQSHRPNSNVGFAGHLLYSYSPKKHSWYNRTVNDNTPTRTPPIKHVKLPLWLYDYQDYQFNRFGVLLHLTAPSFIYQT